MAAPSSLAHTLHLIHHINDETIVYLDLAKHDDSIVGQSPTNASIMVGYQYM